MALADVAFQPSPHEDYEADGDGTLVLQDHNLEGEAGLDWIVIDDGKVELPKEKKEGGPRDEGQSTPPSSPAAAAAASSAIGAMPVSPLSPSFLPTSLRSSPLMGSIHQLPSPLSIGKGYTRMLRDSALNLAKAAYAVTPTKKEALDMAATLTRQSYSLGKQSFGWMMKTTS